MPNLSHRPGQPAVDADWTYWPAFRRGPDTHRLRLSTQIKGGAYCVDMCSLLLREQTTLGRRAGLCSKILLMHISPFETKVEYSRGEGPKLKHTGFASPPFIGMGRYAGAFRQPIA